MDSMNVDALPMDPLADAGDETDSDEDHLLKVRRHVQVHEEVPLIEEGDSQHRRATLHRGIAR